MEAIPELRLYYNIWNQLKNLEPSVAQTVGISVTAPRPLHKRIIKAVKKEKWMDIVYKISIEPRSAVLATSRSGSIITFTLHRSLCIDDF